MEKTVFRVVGFLPDGKKRTWRDFATEQEAIHYVALMSRGCTPCAKKSFGELQIEKINQ